MMVTVDIYATRWCPYYYAAKALLARKGVVSAEIDVTAIRQRRSEMIERANGRTTIPQIFIGATHVGGSDELHALDQAGALDTLIAGESETA